MAEYTSASEVEAAYSTLRATFQSGKTKEIAWRKWQLKQLWWLVEDNEQRILQALNKDLNRHAFEASFVECGAIKNDIIMHLQHIDEWTADRVPNSGFVMNAILRPIIRPEPLGVALILGPWNFPISLLLQPMIAAITAGCAVMLKPSEMTPASQALLVELVPKYMDTSAIRVVTGGPAETTALLERKFDHIFFTGSVNVARHVAKAAAKHLTPTVLELGGQCPAIVTETADIESAAKSIAWAKYMNSGQICLSVNHVFAHPTVQKKLIERMCFYFNEFNNAGPDAMTRVVNHKNFTRLKGLLEKTQGKVVYGGELDDSIPRISPSIVTNVEMTDSLLSEELFGSICPVLTSSTQEAIDAINSNPHPLGIYVFSRDQKEIDHVLSSTMSGGVTVNGVITHASVPDAPFGGVGDSGHGAYHGDHGFKAFTHMRTIARPIPLFSKFMSFVLPPYSVDNLKRVAVKNTLGLQRRWSLEDERRSAKKGLVVKSSVRILKVLTFLTVLGLIDYRVDQRLGVIHGAQALVGYVKSILPF